MCLFCSFRSSFQNSACSFQKQRNCRYSNFPYFSGFLRCNRQKSLKYQAFRQILSRPKPPSKIAKQPLIHKTRNAAYGKTKPGTGRVTQLLPVPASCSGVPKPAFAQILLTIENGIGIDLSPCIGIYQEAEFFSNYNIDKEIELRKELDGNRKKEKYDKILSEKSIEKKILFLVSEETKQKRYRTQVNLPFVPEESRLKLIDRLKTKFSENENVQVHCEIPFLDKNGRKICNAIGFADVVNDETVYELKFVSELKHTHFLQCACYMIALNLDKGILWNTRNNKAYVIKILD